MVLPISSQGLSVLRVFGVVCWWWWLSPHFFLILLGVIFKVLVFFFSFQSPCQQHSKASSTPRQVSLHDELKMTTLEEEEEEEEEKEEEEEEGEEEEEEDLATKSTQTAATAFQLSSGTHPSRMVLLDLERSVRSPPGPADPGAVGSSHSYKDIFREIFLVLSRAKSPSSSLPPSQV